MIVAEDGGGTRGDGVIDGDSQKGVETAEGHKGAARDAPRFGYKQ